MRLLVEIYPTGDDLDPWHRFEFVRNGDEDIDRVAARILDALLALWVRRDDGEAVASGG